MTPATKILKAIEYATHIDVLLSRPFNVNGVPTTALRMREPTVLDKRVSNEYKGSVTEQELLFIANLCDVSLADMGAMPMRDYQRLQTAVGESFLD